MVIYLNGSINAGKTTVANLLAEMIPCAVLIEIDDLPAPRKMPLELSIKPLLRDAADLARNWHQRGFPPIVVWPISQEDLAEFTARLGSAGASVLTITLAPKCEIAMTNRGNRELTDWERERIQYHYSIGIHRPSFGKIVSAMLSALRTPLTLFLHVTGGQDGRASNAPRPRPRLLGCLVSPLSFRPATIGRQHRRYPRAVY
jgi:hypothetical protein